ncbi:helix-turn-helix domain-containing protein [Streptosporangium sp. NPDC002544]|uniref:TetR/AcrR family transcriptional regulator n=1 Tax=Streptosporangium sp. NPDC002544 TaxID=3154538 RepID=UPI003318332D
MPYGAQGPIRQDAQRNRLAIIQAAVNMMSDPRSPLVMPEVARRAGVSQATVYRHFPDRTALADAVIAHQMSRLEACAGDIAWPPAFSLLPVLQQCGKPSVLNPMLSFQSSGGRHNLPARTPPGSRPREVRRHHRAVR